MRKALPLLLAAALLGTLSAGAATKYQINVAGVEVTSDNAGGVTGGDIKGGTVTYDATNKILTLKGVTISRTGGSNYGVHNRDMAGLTIRFEGTNNITCDKANALHFDKTTYVRLADGATVNLKMSAGENLNRGVVYINGNVSSFRGAGTLNVTANYSSSSKAPCAFEGTGKTSNSTLGFAEGIKVVTNSYGNAIYKFKAVNAWDSDLRFKHTNTTSAMNEVGAVNLSYGEALVTPADGYLSNGSYPVTSDNSGNNYTHITSDYGLIISSANFPNANFRTYMRSLCSTGEQYLTKAQLQALTALNVPNEGLTDIQGVEKLTYLKTLVCYGNSITSISALPAGLTYLDCSSNKLTALPTLPATLATLFCDYNNFTGLNVTGQSALKELSCANCTKLTTLLCYSNPALTTLNLTGCSALKTIECNNNQLNNSLDLSGCSSLLTLDAHGNRLTGIRNMPSSLTSVNLSDNRLATFAVDSDQSLSVVNVSSNDALTTLSLKNLPALKSLNFGYCPNITSYTINNCPTSAAPNWIPDAVTYFDCRNMGFTKLPMLNNKIQELYCGGNNLTELTTNSFKTLIKLDVSLMPSLTTLNCSGNDQLTSLNVNGCTALATLNCSGTKVATLASLPAALTRLECQNSQVATLDLTDHSKLTYLDCSGTPLTSLKVKGCSGITSLKFADTQVSTINLDDCDKLRSLDCSRTNLQVLQVTGHEDLATLSCRGNTELLTLLCYSNAIKTFYIDNCPKLTMLDCHDNQLTGFSGSSNSFPALRYLNVAGNKIKLDNMDYLVRSLRTIADTESEGALIATGTFTTDVHGDENEITDEHIKKANAKRWLCYTIEDDDFVKLSAAGDEYALGDINGDDIVDVTDMNILINIVLGNESASNHPGNADCDGNGIVDVDDMNIIINLMLGK